MSADAVLRAPKVPEGSFRFFGLDIKKCQGLRMTILVLLLLIPAAAGARDEAAAAKLKKLRIPLNAQEKREDKLAKGIQALIRENALLKKEKDNLKNDIAKYKNDIVKLKNMLAKLKRENKQFKNKNRRLSLQLIPVEGLKKRLAVVYDELGTAYAHVKRYDMAIDAYSQSLAYDPVNPKVHYNMALLYQHSRNEAEKAVYHLKLYLRLNRNARDRKEVEYLIRTLSQIVEEVRVTDTIINAD